MTEIEVIECEDCGRKLHTAESRARRRGDVCQEKASPTPSRARPVPVRRRLVQPGPDLFTAIEETPVATSSDPTPTGAAI